MERVAQALDEEFDWTGVLPTAITVCTNYIHSRMGEERVGPAVTLQFRNGERRGMLRCRYLPEGKSAYYRTGSVFEITHMMAAPSGGDIIHRTVLALMRDRSLHLGCVRLESVLDDALLTKYVRKGWKLRNPYDNSPLFSRESFKEVHKASSCITRAIRSRGLQKRASVN